MGVAMVDLHWTAEEFWRSTPHEFHAALELFFERTPEGQKRVRRRKFADLPTTIS
jgi:hypothetical protein